MPGVTMHILNEQSTAHRHNTSKRRAISVQLHSVGYSARKNINCTDYVIVPGIRKMWKKKRTLFLDICKPHVHTWGNFQALLVPNTLTLRDSFLNVTAFFFEVKRFQGRSISLCLYHPVRCTTQAHGKETMTELKITQYVFRSYKYPVTFCYRRGRLQHIIDFTSSKIIHSLLFILEGPRSAQP